MNQKFRENDPEYNRIDIAVGQIHAAISHHMEKEYFNAIPLAAAAEEVLGKMAEARGHPTTLADITQHLSQTHGETLGFTDEKTIQKEILNWPKNRLKHFDSDESVNLRLDPEHESMSMVIRAIGNYLGVVPESGGTTKMQEFIQFVRLNNFFNRFGPGDD
jgi:hypothetical protein